jgi:hypothetical protein
MESEASYKNFVFENSFSIKLTNPFVGSQVVDPVKPGRKKNKKAEEKTDGEETDKGAKKGEKEGSKDKDVEDKRKKRKIRLDMHLDQVIFLLTSDIFFIDCAP